MMPDHDLAVQLNGQVVQAVIEGCAQALDAYDDLVAYWSSLTIDSAGNDDGTLDFIGELCGYPRPIVTTLFFLTNLLQLSDATLGPVNDLTTGLGSVYTPGVGGSLDSALPLAHYKMPPQWYRQLLKVMGKVKWYGLTIYTIDLLADWANTIGLGTGYTISRNAYNNILVTFTTVIDSRELWIINAVFAKMETIPLVVAQQP